MICHDHKTHNTNIHIQPHQQPLPFYYPLIRGEAISPNIDMLPNIYSNEIGSQSKPLIYHHKILSFFEMYNALRVIVNPYVVIMIFFSQSHENGNMSRNKIAKINFHKNWSEIMKNL